MLILPKRNYPKKGMRGRERTTDKHMAVNGKKVINEENLGGPI